MPPYPTTPAGLLRAHSGYRLQLVGHSMGGSVAALAALMVNLRVGPGRCVGAAAAAGAAAGTGERARGQGRGQGAEASTPDGSDGKRGNASEVGLFGLSISRTLLRQPSYDCTQVLKVHSPSCRLCVLCCVQVHPSRPHQLLCLWADPGGDGATGPGLPAVCDDGRPGLRPRAQAGSARGLLTRPSTTQCANWGRVDGVGAACLTLGLPLGQDGACPSFWAAAACWQLQLLLSLP